MYELPQSLLVANPINRYLINSPMLPSLVPDPDGGYTLLHPERLAGHGKEANWLPAPKGPFMLVLRLYWPKPDALNGTWKAPQAREGLAAAVKRADLVLSGGGVKGIALGRRRLGARRSRIPLPQDGFGTTAGALVGGRPGRRRAELAS